MLLPSGSSLRSNPAMPVLLRPDGAVQVGWDPRRAVLVRPPSGLTAAALAELLRVMQSGVNASRCCRRWPEGVDAAVSRSVASLVDAGVVTAADGARRTRSASIRIHGRGPLSDLLAGALRCSGARIRHSSQTPCGAGRARTDLVVLSDFLVADPRVVARAARRPDAAPAGAGARRRRAGRPAGHPGVTSCLGCADLHRSDRDAAWPAVARRSCATPSAAPTGPPCWPPRRWRSTRSTASSGPCAAAFDSIAPPQPPSTLDTTLEFDVNAGSTVARRWSRHPRASAETLLPSRAVHRPSGMMVWWLTSNGAAPRATPSWRACLSAWRAGPRSASANG